MNYWLSASVLITSLVALTACTKGDDLLEPDGSKAFRLIVEEKAIPADGSSQTTIHAILPRDTSSTNRSVKFKTSAGMLVSPSGNSAPGTEATVLADGDGDAMVQLRSSGVVETARVEAKAGNFARQRKVAFEAALPEAIDVDPGTFSLEAGVDHEITVTAHLLRSVGVPTQNTPVSYLATDISSTPVGAFRNPTRSDASGISTVHFTAGATMYRGSLTLTARVQSATGAIIEGHAVIQIVNPSP